MDWLEPWYAIEAAEHAQWFAAELQQELSPGHPLYGTPVELLGRRDDREDFLFHLLDGSGRVAEVHLTFRGSKEPPPYPVSRIYASLAEWEVLCMTRDHEEGKP